MLSTRTAVSLLSPGTLRHIEREALDLGITVDELVDRALVGLADKIGAGRPTGEGGDE